MTDQEKQEFAKQLLATARGGCNCNRLRKLIEVINRLTADDLAKLRIEECSDEHTGRRYGQAKCRQGKCEKIGWTTYDYQVWAVWA